MSEIPNLNERTIRGSVVAEQGAGGGQYYEGMSNIVRLALIDLLDKQGQETPFTEVYFETASGSMYSIGRVGKPIPGLPVQFGIMNAFDQEKGKPLMYTPLSEEELKRSVLEENQSFHYGEHGVTTPVKKIVAVNTRKPVDKVTFARGSYDNTMRTFWDSALRR